MISALSLVISKRTLENSLLRLIQGCSAFLDHLRPFCSLCFDERPEILRGITDEIGSCIRENFLIVGLRHDLQRLAVQFGDNILRRGRRCEETIPAVGFKSL